MSTSLFAAPLGSPRFRAFAADGTPLNAGKVYVYQAGLSTPDVSYPTYADALAGTNANAFPVVLSAAGEATIFLQTGRLYKIVCQDSSSVQQWEVDSVNPATTTPDFRSPWIAHTFPGSIGTYSTVTGTSLLITGSTGVYPGTIVGTFSPGRRLKIIGLNGTTYGTITSSSADNDLHVSFAPDTNTAVLADPISAVYYGFETTSSPAYLDPRTVVAVIKSGNQTDFNPAAKVTTWTEEIDSNAEFASDKFTCVYPGKYLVAASVELSDTSATIGITVAIRKSGNDAAKHIGYTHATGGNHTTHVIPGKPLSLAVGDYVELFVTGSDNTTVYGTNTTLNVTRVP